MLLALVAAGLLAGATPVAIRIDQVGVERDGIKIAIVETDAPRPVRWTLRDAAGAAVATGDATPAGVDPGSGKRVQQIDFIAVSATGTGFRLSVDTAASPPFAIADRPFRPLATAAMAFFYQQRSGVPILRALVERPDLARAAGHPHERVTCFASTDTLGITWPGCAYRLETTGGWYDAGDHGKYVVNGGIAAWTLLDLHQRLAAWGDRAAFADGRLALPERANGVDDLLDEARVEVSFLLSMQVPQGQRLRVATKVDDRTPASGFVEIDAGGLAHAKVTDTLWTGIPLAPADDAVTRALYPPTTAATLNLAAVAAQAARVWRTIDPAFAARALAAAARAWDAAERTPVLYASSGFTGGGGYGDQDVADERFWAASELYATTGDARYRRAVETSGFLRKSSGALGWGQTDLAGMMTLATLPTPVPEAVRAIVTLADAHVAERAASGYRLPYASTRYDWGSNAVLLNRAMVLGAAWQLTHRAAYRDAVVDVVDYLLGRNALGQSYVSGFGTQPMRTPHHRFWAVGADARYPAPPAGVLSGGPNSTAMDDDVARPMKGHCTGQTCWRDDWRAFTMNEVAINWNAPLVWAAAFLDATRPAPTPRLSVPPKPAADTP